LHSHQDKAYAAAGSFVLLLPVAACWKVNL